MNGYEQEYERPFKTNQHSNLNNLSDLPKWKEPDYFGTPDWDTENPYPSTDFKHPDYIDREDWW